MSTKPNAGPYPSVGSGTGRPAALRPFGRGSCVAADQLLLLGVHADDRPTGGQILLGLLADVAKLRVPVGVLGALLGLAGALQRVALLLEQPPHGVVADRVALRAKRVGKLAGGLAGPAQRRLRVASASGSTRASSASSRPAGARPAAWAHHLGGAPGRPGRGSPRPTICPVCTSQGCYRTRRKNSRTSRTSNSGTSMAAKCPPRSNCRRRVNTGSAPL